MWRKQRSSIRQALFIVCVVGGPWVDLSCPLSGCFLCTPLALEPLFRSLKEGGLCGCRGELVVFRCGVLVYLGFVGLGSWMCVVWHEVVASVELFCVLGIFYGGESTAHIEYVSCAFPPWHGDVDWGLHYVVEIFFFFLRVGGLGA